VEQEGRNPPYLYPALKKRSLLERAIYPNVVVKSFDAAV
jgi:hypothetical protein